MKIKQESILDFISKAATFEFQIPEYQRNYSWTAKEAVVLFEDLQRIIDNAQDQFFGNIICESDYSEAIIIDGQQRITTVLLMITAICHLVQRNPERSTKGLAELRDFLIQRREDAMQPLKLKLRTNTQDSEVFFSIYIEQVSPANQNTHLYKAYLALRNAIDKSEQDDLFEFIKALKHMQIAGIILENNDDSPQMIFESINSKGMELKPSDKIRNYSLFVKDHKLRQHVYNNYWLKIEKALVDITQKKDDIDDFFNSLIVKHFGYVITQNELYEKFKQFFLDKLGNHSPSQSQIDEYYQSVMGDLKRYCFLKYEICKPEDGYSEWIIYQNHRMKRMNVYSPASMPFLISVLERYESGQCNTQHIQRIFELLETLLVRRYLCREPHNVFRNALALSTRG